VASLKYTWSCLGNPVQICGLAACSLECNFIPFYNYLFGETILPLKDHGATLPCLLNYVSSGISLIVGKEAVASSLILNFLPVK